MAASLKTIHEQIDMSRVALRDTMVLNTIRFGAVLACLKLKIGGVKAALALSEVLSVEEKKSIALSKKKVTVQEKGHEVIALYTIIAGRCLFDSYGECCKKSKQCSQGLLSGITHRTNRALNYIYNGANEARDLLKGRFETLEECTKATESIKKIFEETGKKVLSCYNL